MNHSQRRRSTGLASLLLILTVMAALGIVLGAGQVARAQTDGYALRFFGTGVDDVDRVKIPLRTISAPINVGDDFTLEFWLKADMADNNSAACFDGPDNWIYGNIVLDRDVWGDGDFGDYGLSIAGGRVAFGVNNGVDGAGICGDANVADGQWHHIAVTRSVDGELRIFVDGTLDGVGDGPTGDLRYRAGRETDYEDDPFLVIGAEKHDAGAEYPSFNGYLDELRISNVVRYITQFAPPSAPFVSDDATVALYHFDEGPAGACRDTVIDSALTSSALTSSALRSSEASDGRCNFGGREPNAGPLYVVDTPFVQPAQRTQAAVDTATATRPATATTLPRPTATPTARATAAGVQAESAVLDYALDFDGEDDIVRFDELSLPSLFTVEFHVNPAVDAASGAVIAHGDEVSGWSIELNQGQVEFWLATDRGWQPVVHPAELEAGRWHHVAAIYVAGRVRLFVDGVAAPSQRVGLLKQGRALSLGGLSTRSHFRGAVDELRISRTVRYVGDFTPPNAPFAVDERTVGLWQFDEGNGQIARDSTSAANHGVLGNSGRVDEADPVWIGGFRVE